MFYETSSKNQENSVAIMPKEIFRRFKRNAAMVIGSRLIFGALNVATVAMAVRLLGLQDFGVVILLHSYTRLFNDIIKFESWQAVVTYGARLQTKTDNVGFRKLLGLLLGLDLVGMLLSATFAIIFIPYAARIFSWPPEVSNFAPLYVLSLFFIAQASPTGILRLFDRVDVLATEFAIRALVKFLGVLSIFYFDGGVFDLVVVWFVSTVISGLWPMLICARELYVRNLIPIFRVNWLTVEKNFKGIWRFLFFSNLSSSVGFLYTTGTTLFLGSTLGSASAALVEIAYQFSGALSRPIRILGPIISPEFAKLAAKSDWRTFRKIISQQLKITSTILLLVSVVLFSVLNFVLSTIYGNEILEHVWLFRFLVVFVLLKILTFTFDPAILAANKPGTLLLVRTGVAFCYVLIALSLLDQYGIASVGFAALVGQILYIFTIALIGKKLLKKRVRKMRL